MTAAARPAPDAVDEALTELWMANTLCLTFLTLNAIAFACLAWAVPVIARTLAARVVEVGAITGALLQLGQGAAAHPWATAATWLGLSAGALALQLGWESRRGRIRLFALASVPPALLTLTVCGAALLA
jgi:hypothetical protein